MTRPARPLALGGSTAAVGAAIVVATAGPAAAHGLGGRSDLPLPVWMFTYGAAGALVVSFAALAVFWPVARFEGGTAGVVVPPAVPSVTEALSVVGRIVGLAVYALVLGAAAFGDAETAGNIAPVAVYVVFWVGMILLSGLVGDLWRVLSPIDTLAAAAERAGGGTRGVRSPNRRPRGGYRPAAALLFAFLWLELVYPDRAEPRVLAVAIAGYTVVVLAGAVRYGRAWLRQGEAFAAFFGVLAQMAPLYAHGSGRLRLRPPLAGLATLEHRPGLEALIFVGLGSTTFDGVTRPVCGATSPATSGNGSSSRSRHWRWSGPSGWSPSPISGPSR